MLSLKYLDVGIILKLWQLTKDIFTSTFKKFEIKYTNRIAFYKPRAAKRWITDDLNIYPFC